MTRPRTRTLRAALLLVIALSVNVAHGDDAPLRWKFTEGKTFQYEFSQKNDITLKTEGREVANSVELVLEMTWTVKSTPDNAPAEIGMVVKRVRATVLAGKQEVKFDTNDKEPSQDAIAKALATIYTPVIGPEFLLKIDARGQIVEAKVPEKVTSAIQGSPFQSFAAAGGLFSDTGLRDTLAQMLPTLPEKAAAPGDSWKTRIDMPVQPLSLSMAFDTKIAMLDADSARLESNIETTITPLPNSPFKIEVKKQTGNGSAVVDRKAGRLKESSIQQSINLNLSINNMPIEQIIQINERIKLID